MSKYIYCSPPARAHSLAPLLFFFAPTAVCQPPLLPFHTVITHLYIPHGGLLCSRSLYFLSPFLSLWPLLALRFIARARARVHSRDDFARATHSRGTRLHFDVGVFFLAERNALLTRVVFASDIGLGIDLDASLIIMDRLESAE